ncbi:MAG: CDP-alcohol phosphatidyltransferase family protein [Ktedonobacterales bacterium]
MFGARIQRAARRFAELVVRPLAALGVTPNMATFLGLLLNGLTAAVIATGHLRIGGLLLLFAGMFDMVDGALARVRDQKTTFGAFFDSTLDRYSEGLVLLGVILFALTLPATSERTWLVALTYVAGLSSLMVSYARARAESLGLDGKTGLMARPERVVLLAAGLLIGSSNWLLWTIGILAVTTTFTAIQRIVSVWRTLAQVQTVQVSPKAPATNGTGATHDEQATQSDSPTVRRPSSAPSDITQERHQRDTHDRLDTSDVISSEQSANS